MAVKVHDSLNGVSLGEFKQLVKDQHLLSNELREAVKKALEEQTKWVQELQKTLQKQFQPLQKAFEEFAKKFPESLQNLAKSGWYICAASPISDAIYLNNLLKQGENHKVDLHMQEFYESEFKKLTNILVNDFPERKKLILEGVRAHKKNMYFASTILFLSIADGLCSGSLFMIRDEKKKLKKTLKNTNTLDAFVSIITNISAIDAHTTDMSKYPSSLNRHAVMHGHDFVYGTKINSLKAFSLLAFIGDFIGRKINKKS